MHPTSLGYRPEKVFLSVALDILCILLVNLMGWILVIILAIRWRFLRQGPSFDASFPPLLVGISNFRRNIWVFEDNGFEFFRRVVIFVAARWGIYIESLLYFYVDQKYEKRWAQLTSCARATMEAC